MMATSSKTRIAEGHNVIMGVHASIQEEVRTGTLSEPIPRLSLFAHGSQIASGSGHLIFGKDQRLMLTVYAESIPSNHSQRLLAGTLVFPDERPLVQGNTLRGFALQAEGLVQEGCRGWDPGFAECVFTTHECTLSTELPIEGWLPELDGYILPVNRFPTNRRSAEGYDNSVFGTGSRWDSWFELESQGTRTGLEADDNEAHLRVQTTQDSAQTAIASSEAFLHALSFRMGKRHSWLVFTIRGDGKETTVIRCPSDRQGTWYPPLPPFLPDPAQMQTEANLLEKASVYFVNSSHRPVADILDICRLASLTNFPLESLLLGSALEGLASYVIELSPSTKLPSNEAVQFEKLKQTVIQVLQTDSRVCNDPSISRIISRVNGTSHDHHVIKEAAKSLGIALSDAEFGAWRKTQHPRAHGNFAVNPGDRRSVQDEANQQACVANLINKFVLALVGYAGTYVDYSSPGYPTRTFPS
jgi:hypothetical protein